MFDVSHNQYVASTAPGQAPDGGKALEPRLAVLINGTEQYLTVEQFSAVARSGASFSIDLSGDGDEHPHFIVGGPHE